MFENGRRGARARVGWVLVATTITALMMGACGSDPTDEDTGVPDLFASLWGSWDWIQSVGGIAGGEINPQTEGYTLMVIFVSPDRVIYEQENQEREQTTFQVIVKPENPDGFDIVYASPIRGQDRQEIELFGDLLILFDPCCDGFVSEYSRN